MLLTSTFNYLKVLLLANTLKILVKEGIYTIFFNHKSRFECIENYSST